MKIDFHPASPLLGLSKAPFSWAVQAGIQSPCEKSKRGVALFMITKDDLSVYTAFNSPPGRFYCTKTDKCKESCNKLCMHAEMRVLLKAHRPSERGILELVHVKIDTDNKFPGIVAPSGPPSCWQCSRMILDWSDRVGVWLYREDGWIRYNAEAFHAYTLEECGLGAFPGSRDERHHEG